MQAELSEQLAVSTVLGATPESAAGFTRWIEPHLPAMSRLAARMAPYADSDDVVQEALTRAWRKRGQYRGDRGAPSAWLLTITANVARGIRRRRDYQHRPELPDLPESRTVDVDLDVDVERALESLSRRQRLAVDCFYFVGLSLAETAAVMGCTQGTVKSTLYDARARLRPLLQTEEPS